MVLYYMREAQCAAADTDYTLQGNGAGGTVADFTAPQGAHRICSISCSAGFGATAGSAIGIAIVGGPGVIGGPFRIPLVAYIGVGTSVTMDLQNAPHLDVDIPIAGGKTIQLGFCNSGSDSGTPEFAVEVGVE